MDDRFFANQRRYQQPETIRLRDPFYGSGRSPNQAAPKIVQIPVHFVGSEQEVDRSEYALRIQKVFRGFTVRKSVRKILEIESEVEAVEVWLQRSGTADFIDSKEKIRMNETLMSLLLKLDAVRGIDFGVRVLRKAVIRKAITLQERIDALPVAVSFVNGTETASSVNMIENNSESSMDPHNSHCKEEESVMDSDPICEVEDNIHENATDNEANYCKEEESLMDSDPICEVEDHLHENATDDEANHCKEEESLMDSDPICEVEDNLHENATDDEANYCNKEGELVVPEYGVVSESGAAEEKENKRRREFLERMAEDNGKMMKMMEQLCERNETQARMLEALSKRVGVLEKAVVCDLLRRGQKKNKKKKTVSPDLWDEA